MEKLYLSKRENFEVFKNTRKKDPQKFKIDAKKCHLMGFCSSFIPLL